MKLRNVFIFIVIACAGGLNAGQLHVGQGQAYAHPQDAWEAASSGDEIVIHAGTYNSVYSHFVLRTDMYGTVPKNNILIHPYNGETVVIHGMFSISGTTAAGMGNITIDGLYFDLTFDSSAINRTAFWLNCDTGQTLMGCTFRNNVVYNLGNEATNNYTDQFIYIKKNGNHGQHLIEHNTMVNLGVAVDTGYGVRDEVNGWTPANVPTIRSNIIVNSLRGVYSQYRSAGINYAYGDVNDCAEYNFSHPDLLGTGTVELDPVFYSTDPANPYFLYLSPTSPLVVRTGAHDGASMGALQLVDLDCGDWGYLESDLDENCYVDINDVAVFASRWLNCTDLTNPNCN